jgi:hypothetical protein
MPRLVSNQLINFEIAKNSEKIFSCHAKKILKEAPQSTLASLFNIMPKCKNIINFLAESK